MKLFEPQPAHLMYPFQAGWQVMSYVYANVFARTDTEARGWFAIGSKWEAKAKAEDNVVLKYWYYCVYAGAMLAGAFQYVAAMVIVAAFMVLQFLFLLVWSGSAAVLMALLTIANSLYASYYKIFVRCPTCYAQMRIPIHVCPSCATEHSRLWPSVYGVFHHRCAKCNSRLPTLGLLGRDEIVKKCIACSRPMNKRVGQLVNVHIPIIGGPSCGKSNFIFMATRELIESYAKPRKYEIEFPDERDEARYAANLRELGLGRPLAKTPDIAPEAYNLTIRRPGERLGRILYVYDAAGEAYIDKDNTVLQTYYDYVDGIVFIIDPTSIDVYRRKHADWISALHSALRPSTLDVMDAYGRMIEVLEQSVGLRRGSRFSHPIAVIISKADALDLDDLIGDSAVKRLMQADLSFVLEEDASDFLVEQFLVQHELGNLVRSLRNQFEQVRFFSSSALGRMPDKSSSVAFAPRGVLPPILWMLGVLGVAASRKERLKKVDAQHRSIGRRRGGFLNSLRYYYWESLRPRRR